MMSDDRRFFEALAGGGADPEPTADQERVAFELLRTEIQSPAPVRRPRRRAAPAIVALAVVATAVIVGLGVRPDPAGAAITEIAHAAREAEPDEIPDGRYLYVRFEETVMGVSPVEVLGLPGEGGWAAMYTKDREMWTVPGTGFTQFRTTVHPPSFFDPDIEPLFYEAGLDVIEEVGQTVVRRFNGVNDPDEGYVWSADRGRLEDQMLDYTSHSDAGTSRNGRLFQLAGQLLVDPSIDPGLRATLIEILGEAADEVVVGEDGSVMVGIEIRLPTHARLTVTLAPDGGVESRSYANLDGIPELGVPPGTVTGFTRYLDIGVVDVLPDS